jgi:GHMP kinases N terminal domain
MPVGWAHRVLRNVGNVLFGMPNRTTRVHPRFSAPCLSVCLWFVHPSIRLSIRLPAVGSCAEASATAGSGLSMCLASTMLVSAHCPSVRGSPWAAPWAVSSGLSMWSASMMLISVHCPVLQGLPLGSGLGSSAASAAAGAMAVNGLFGSPLSKEQLVPAGLMAEASVSGYHADNIAPALLGGFVLIR